LLKSLLIVICMTSSRRKGPGDLPQPPEAQGLSVCRALVILIASTSNGHYGDTARRFVHVSRLGTLLRNKRSLSPGTLLKLPTPENCQSEPTAPMKAEPVI
jgi:hypothetical protein